MSCYADKLAVAAAHLGGDIKLLDTIVFASVGDFSPNAVLAVAMVIKASAIEGSALGDTSPLDEVTSADFLT